MSIAHRRLRWTGGLLLLSIGLAGCDLITGNAPEASTIVISPSGITLDAIGATATLSAEVRDQNDQILGNEVVTWSSSDPNVATISPAGLVTAVRNGTATITAAAGAASGSVNLSVTQLATMLEKVSGDGQLGPAGEPLPEPLVVHALDRLGNPAIGVPVEFQIIEGGGSPTPAQTQTDVQGRASTTWTLGALAGEAQAIRGFLSFSVGQGVNFEATAVPGLPLVKVSGDQQSGVVGTLLIAPLVVRVTDTFGNPVAGSTITFGPASGDGSVFPTQATSDSNGTAATEWTLGSSLGSQSVGASIETGATVIFTATANGVGGLAIELLFLDQPTAPQRQAFDDAVSRWAALIPGKLEPVPVNFPAGACGSNSPAINQVVDDLLVFVSLDSIDLAGGTLGLAQVCSARLSNGLPIVAHLTLDTNDIGLLEASGRLVDLILHELGHALGFGSLWVGKGFLQNPSLPANPGADTHFDGPSAVTAFDAIGGNAYTGQKVPVENQEGGPGNRDSHWRLAVFRNELMTGVLAAGANPLSRVTVASLGDLGYSVDEGGADAFQLNLFAAPPAVGEEVEMFPLGDDVLRGTIYLLDEEGRVRGALE